MRLLRRRQPLVFISYRHKQHRQYVGTVAEALGRAGYTIWLDQEKSAVSTGIDPRLDLKLRRALLRADLMLFLMSPEEDPDVGSDAAAPVVHPSASIRADSTSPTPATGILASFLQLRADLDVRLARGSLALARALQRTGEFIKRVAWTASGDGRKYIWYSALFGTGMGRVQNENWQRWERRVAVAFELPVLKIGICLRGTDVPVAEADWNSHPDDLLSLVERSVIPRIAAAREERIRRRLLTRKRVFKLIRNFTPLLLGFLLLLVLFAWMLAIVAEIARLLLAPFRFLGRMVQR